MSLQIQSINKSYADQQVLFDLSFNVKNGEIVGFLGPNGAGKSSLMKIMTGYLYPDSGKVWIDDICVQEKRIEAQKLIGYLPEHNPLYLDLYVKEYLNFTAKIYNLGAERADRVDAMIEKCGLKSEFKKKIGQLSKGYRQRVGLAAAMIHNPQVLILDEPTTGLDPNQLVEIRELIKDFGRDRTVLFSTHIMQEVSAICDRFLVLKKGVLVADRPTNKITSEELEALFRELTN